MLEHRFDVFLSYNRRDERAVIAIAEKLKQAGMKPWLDRWCLTAGRRYLDELEEALRSCATCAVCVGPSKPNESHRLSEYVKEEISVAHNLAVADPIHFRVFLVLLPGVPEVFDATTLPAFLINRTWVDLRQGIEDASGFHALESAIKGVPVGPPTSGKRTVGDCPYRGLEVFDEEHAALYFGRDADIQRLVEKLKASHFLAVIGPSGSGKSSLVRAGLIPTLRKGALFGSQSWQIRVLKPGAHPLTALASHLTKVYPRESIGKTLDQMNANQRTMHLNVVDALADSPDSELIVWVIDQFEEVFTLCQDEQERQRFLENLLYAVSMPDSRNVVILTMRSDFYSRCAAYPELAAHMGEHQYLVSPMSLDGLRQAIERPAWHAGLEFEAGLVDTILEDIKNQPGALPLLEHALLELCERRQGRLLTLKAYVESGGVEGAIAKRAEDIYQKLSPEEQEIVRRVMLRLTQPGEGTEDTRRRAPISELLTHPEEQDAVDRVVGELVEARLLTTSGEKANA